MHAPADRTAKRLSAAEAARMQKLASQRRMPIPADRRALRA